MWRNLLKLFSFFPSNKMRNHFKIYTFVCVKSSDFEQKLKLIKKQNSRNGHFGIILLIIHIKSDQILCSNFITAYKKKELWNKPCTRRMLCVMCIDEMKWRIANNTSDLKSYDGLQSADHIPIKFILCSDILVSIHAIA